MSVERIALWLGAAAIVLWIHWLLLAGIASHGSQPGAQLHLNAAAPVDGESVLVVLSEADSTMLSADRQEMKWPGDVSNNVDSRQIVASEL